MAIPLRTTLALLSLSVLAACTKTQTLTSITPLDTHADCPAAATLVSAGQDSDADGLLSEAEVSTVAVVCGSTSACTVVDSATQTTITCASHPVVTVPKAAEGVTLVSISDGAPTTACPAGTVLVQSGADDSGDGVLQASEVADTQTACAPPLLTFTEALATDAACLGSATLVHAGPDRDGDGQLAASERAISAVVCGATADCGVIDQGATVTITCGDHPPVQVLRPAAGATLVTVSNFGAVTDCLAGGFTIRSGADDGPGAGEANNGQLDASEVEVTRALCAGACGDSTTDAVLGETCDDGNTMALDGCDATCRREPVCLPPSPEPGCPPFTFHVETISPSAVPTAGATVSLLGAFPSNTSLSNTTLVLAPGSVTLTPTAASPTQVRFVMPAGVGARQLDLDISGLDVPLWIRQANPNGTVTVVVSGDLPITTAKPVITSTAGCADDLFPRAQGCASGDTLTIDGSDFGPSAAQIAVTVGGALCTGLTLQVPHSRIACVLPAGAGFEQPVGVTVAGQSNQAPATLDYAGAVITGASSANTPLDPGDTVFPVAPLTLRVFGMNFGTTNPRVVATNGITTHTVVPSMATATELEFSIPAVMGAGWRLQVEGPGGALSRPSTFTFSTPAPVLRAGTLRAAVGDPGSSTLLIDPSGSQQVFFDVDNLVAAPWQLSVSFGPYACRNISVLGAFPNHSLSCLLDPASGGPYTFTVDNGRTSAPGTDTVQFPPGPTLTEVTGCGGDCPTEGGVVLEVVGSGFVAPASVTVGGLPCPGAFISSTQLRCLLPAGVGNVPVVVSSNSMPSAPLMLSYGAPEILSVSGCNDGTNSTSNCPATGGVPITLTGRNLGASGGTVLVGGALCTGLSVLVPHTSVSCMLPATPGSGQQSVWFVNGKSSQSPFFIFTGP